MNAVTPVFLVEAGSGKPVKAELRDAIEEPQLLDWQFQWRPALIEYLKRLVAAGVPKSQWPQSWHWDWQAKQDKIEGLLGHRSFCIVCRNVTQAMMQLDVASKRARIESQKGKHLVYINYLEIAPWNWAEPYADPPHYRGAGAILLRAAIETSRAEEFKGRIGLHSLPQAVPFYEHCGMENLGPDPDYQNLPYLEMTPEQAEIYTSEGNKG